MTDAIIGAVFLICATVLILAFGGEPDLMDAVIARLGASHA